VGDFDDYPHNPPPGNQRVDGHAQHDDLVARLVGAVVIGGVFLLVFCEPHEGCPDQDSPFL
jgi:hypothetical protein